MKQRWTASARAIILGVSVFLRVAICLGMLRYARAELEPIRFVATSVEAADRENMDFLLLCLLPLLFTAPWGGAPNWD